MRKAEYIAIGVILMMAATTVAQVISIRSGDGSGLTNLHYTQMVGSLPAGSMPAGYSFLYSGETGITLGGIFSGSYGGDGSLVTNISGANIQSGTVNSNSLDAATKAQLALAGSASSLAASAITGVLSVSQLPTNIAFLNSNETFTANQTVSGTFSPIGNTNYSVNCTGGTAYSLTTTPATVAINGTNVSLTLNQSGKYIIFASAQMSYVGATLLANQTATFKLRKTSGTAADLANSSATAKTEILTLISKDYGNIAFPAAFDYAASAGDVLQMFASVTATPTVGSIQATAGSIYAYHASN